MNNKCPICGRPTFWFHCAVCSTAIDAAPIVDSSNGCVLLEADAVEYSADAAIEAARRELKP